GAALRDLRAAERLDPGAARPAELLGDVNFEMGRFARAAESYQAYVARDDRSPRVFYKLGLTRFRAGDAAGALQPLGQAIALDARLPEAHYVLGLCLQALQRHREAIAELEAALTLSPGLVVVREELAGAYSRAGRTRQAVEQLEAIADLEPDRPERQAVVALAWARGGRTDAAVNLLGRAAERNPDHTSVFLALGRIWLDVAEPRRDRVAIGKALAALEPLARRPAASSEALALYGRALLVSGDAVRAEAVLRQASDVFPIRLEALIWHANAAERLGRMTVARQALRRWSVLAADAAPDRSSMLERLAALDLRAGDPQAARDTLVLAVDAPGARPSAFAALASLALSRGARDEALTAVTRGLTAFPQDPALQALARRLR
ncbi:tetratricopeptide repeat protein, partial [bacterium]|nr:tetratricopeptide repeat protein [bacterium]